MISRTYFLFDALLGDFEISEDEFFRMVIPSVVSREYQSGNVNRQNFYDRNHVLIAYAVNYIK